MSRAKTMNEIHTISNNFKICTAWTNRQFGSYALLETISGKKLENFYNLKNCAM